ncbi:MAG: hypothetical protein AAF184_21250 [Pseudomonadota bacterium]
MSEDPPNDNSSDNQDLDALALAGRKRRRQQVLIGASLTATLAVVVGAFLWVEATFTPAVDAQRAVTEAPVEIACGEDSGDECSRQDFLDALRVFNFEARPALDRVSLDAWEPTRAEAIDAKERGALDAFDAGKYREATIAITEAVEITDEAIKHAQQTYRDALRKAERAFADNDAPLASQAIERALLIDPGSAAAQALGERIAVLPAVLNALEAARVANVENRPDEELRQLRAALVLDPARTTLSERIGALQGADTANRYRAAVAAAEGALARGDLDQTQRAVDRARAIDPGQDLSLLQQRLDDARAQRRLDDALARAARARDDEDWPVALTAYEQALALDPANADAVRGAKDARAVVDALDRIAIYLEDPLRIGSARAGEAAQRLASDLAPIRGVSAILDGQLDQLDAYLTLATQPVKITLISDGMTEISVRRVGQVGKRKRATIELTPGRYEVEGHRAGYRSKLVALDVNFGIERMQVEVVCDEPAA